MEDAAASFPSIDLASLNEKIYDIIKQRIINADYPPGCKLNVGEISRALGVSHTPVKDALFRLAGEDLVEISSRTGTYVKNITEADIHEIIRTRIILETAVIETVAERITDDQLRQLEDLYQQGLALTVYPNGGTSYRAYMELDSRFHLLIFQFAENNRLLNIYRNLNAHMQFVRFRMMNHAGGKLPTTDREHELILRALREHDPEKAKQAIRDHLLRIDKVCVANPQQLEKE
ncbi:MAG: GntR family transcriptional regulator [Deltaproteobacteria bacterium]|nr:GntR family transcriptional regulator [Deltaproteobacteria bacterium]